MTSNEKVAILKQAELFRSLDDDILTELAAKAVVKKLDRNEVLFIAGEPAKAMYVIASGSVRAFRASTDGREQVIHVERAVTTIAEVPVFDAGTYPSTVAAEERTTVLYLSKEHVLRTAMAHPQLALAGARLMAARLRTCAALVETLALREVGQRLANLLVTEAREHGKETDEGVRFRLRLTHNQLAARIGTVREVVTRMFIRLGEDGLIVHKGKDILIPDVDALASYAD